MKKILLLSICLLIGAWTLSAQQTIYIIDNETVEHFDGSQLKDRTIRDYKITTKGSGRNAITVHAITTSPTFYSFSGSFRSLDPLQPLDTTAFINPVFRKFVYIIDGEVHEDESPFSSISPFDIEKISVRKDGSPEQQEFGEDVTVIEITTRKRTQASRKGKE